MKVLKVGELADLSFTLSQAHFLQTVPREGLVSCGTFRSLFVPPGSWVWCRLGQDFGVKPHLTALEQHSLPLWKLHLGVSCSSSHSLFALIRELLLTPVCL
ncbi:hypothetical protein QQF64_028656 [Cirrhinus molitorella]|uniref:Uncharacterized protein n=1 Tax=Cirrhinus molitorella TaxID=172907 RepID=A0ABR3N791_9TELE